MRSRVLDTEGMDVERQDLDLGRRQPFVPGRHMSLTSAVNGGDDCLQVTAIDPVSVGQVGRAQIPVAFGILAVAGGAIGQKYLLSGLDGAEIGRASCRERVSISVVAGGGRAKESTHRDRS